jgi:hypothetical protein
MDVTAGLKITLGRWSFESDGWFAIFIMRCIWLTMWLPLALSMIFRVADDGSGPSTPQLVREWAEREALPIRHVWHEDRGFRLAEICNRAIRASAGTYIVFLEATALHGAIS